MVAGDAAATMLRQGCEQLADAQGSLLLNTIEVDIEALGSDA